MAAKEGAEVIERISNNISQLKNHVRNFNVFVEKIGGPLDDEQMRNTMNALIEECTSLSKATSVLLKELVILSNTNVEYRASRERLLDQYMAVLNRLQSAQRLAASKEKAKINTVTVEDEILSARLSDSRDAKENIQLQQQHSINLNELRERNQMFTQLESDINDVNQIFKDLARIVHDQGEMVDSIEANIEHAAVYVEDGHTNVQQALYYQTKSRQKKLILLVFFSAFICILLLFFYMWIKPN